MMSVRCWQVEVAHEWRPGKFDRVYVAAESEDEAMRLGTEKSGHTARAARIAFSWLDPEARVPGTPLPELQDGQSRENDGTPGAKHPRTAEVMAWLREYAGRNTFVQDVKFKVENGRQATGRNVGAKKAYRLSHKQVEALAQVKDREGKRSEPGPGVSGLNLWRVLPYGTTRAAAENERGTLSFVRIDKVKDGRWADFVFVKAIIGGNEDMRLGMQGPDKDEYSGQWPVVLRNVAADVEAAVIKFGLEMGVCGHCGSPLTNEESRRVGIGPVCRSKLTA